MNRRSVLKSLGATTIAGSAVLGSGALTQVTAQRNVSISVTNDSNSTVALSPGTSASGGFADITENNNGKLNIETKKINKDGQLIVGDAPDANPGGSTITDTAIEIGRPASDDADSLGPNTVMGINVSIDKGTNNSGNTTNSGMGLVFLPTGSSNDLAQAGVTGYESADVNVVANTALTTGETGVPSLPTEYQSTKQSATFLLDEVQKVGAELLIQADRDDADSDSTNIDADFDITVTAETIDTS